MKLARTRYPTLELTTDSSKLINDKEVDAVVITTPVSTHYSLALSALKANKHVLVEKPMADTSDRCRSLIDEADKRGLILMVDHTFPYNGSVRKIKELINAGELGEINYYSSVRVKGLFQPDVNVVWDLAVHDLSIIDFLINKKPSLVSAVGMSQIKSRPENIAYLTLLFDDTIIAHIHVNWLSPLKMRQIILGGARKMLIYDDLEPTKKIKVYNNAITERKDNNGGREIPEDCHRGGLSVPGIDNTEALRCLTNHFRKCISDNMEPIYSSLSGLRVVQMIEAVIRSMANKGKPESL